LSPKILIAVIVVLLLAMPFVYKQGRVSMKQEAVNLIGKGSFVFNGDIRYLERVVQKNFGVCSNCHTKRGITHSAPENNIGE